MRCEDDSISSASHYISSLYRDPEILPSSWFNSRTDLLLIPLVTKCVSILAEKPLASWENSDFFFITELVTLACGGAMVEEGAGMNLSAKRWMVVFSGCCASLSPELLPLTLWLFTIRSPHDTLAGPALERLDSCVVVAWWEHVSGHQNRSLCRLKRRLFNFNIECGRDFHHRLIDTKKCGHFCFGCIAWNFRVVTASILSTQKVGGG